MGKWNSYLILEVKVLSPEDAKLVGLAFWKRPCLTLRTELVLVVSIDDTNAKKHPHDIMLTAIVIIMFNMMSKNSGFTLSTNILSTGLSLKRKNGNKYLKT